MRCTPCATVFSAARGQGSPGGSSAPGNLLLFAAALAASGVLSLLVGASWLAMTLLLLALFASTQVVIAWSDCRCHRAGAGKELGQPCPRCGNVERVQLWSR